MPQDSHTLAYARASTGSLQDKQLKHRAHSTAFWIQFVTKINFFQKKKECSPGNNRDRFGAKIELIMTVTIIKRRQIAKE
jgi:hypothetical protein